MQSTRVFLDLKRIYVSILLLPNEDMIKKRRKKTKEGKQKRKEKFV